DPHPVYETNLSAAFGTELPGRTFPFRRRDAALCQSRPWYRGRSLSLSLPSGTDGNYTGAKGNSKYFISPRYKGGPGTPNANRASNTFNIFDGYHYESCRKQPNESFPDPDRLGKSRRKQWVYGSLPNLSIPRPARIRIVET